VSHADSLLDILAQANKSHTYAVWTRVSYRVGSRMVTDSVRILVTADSADLARGKARRELSADYDGIAIESVTKVGLA
jgi:hypothetical protein